MLREYPSTQVSSNGRSLVDAWFAVAERMQTIPCKGEKAEPEPGAATRRRANVQPYLLSPFSRQSKSEMLGSEAPHEHEPVRKSCWVLLGATDGTA